MNCAKFLLCVVVILAVGLVNAEDDGRIVNGRLLKIKNAPYMVQLRMYDQLYCGGSLIDANHVVTAAHCLYGLNLDDVTIVGDASSIKEKGTQRRIKKFHIHPEYSKETMHSDMALIKLDKPLHVSRYLQKCSQPPADGEKVQVNGWGKVAENSEISPNLLTVDIPVRSAAACRQQFGPYVKKNMFCASGLADIGSCRGDSGGPAVFKGQLCGVVSFSYKCGQTGQLEAFTSAYDLDNFINDCVKKILV